MMVVDPRYFSSFKVDLAIVRKSLTVADGHLSCVLDVNGNVIFIIKDINFSLHDRHVLLDASEIPILTFKKKHRSIHRRWQAFRNDSTSAKDLIFSTKKTSLIQRGTELSVFLSDNKEESVGDYKVAGDWKKRSCTVYSYDGSTILAQMHNKDIDACIESDKDTYGISVSPNVDYALVVALMVILYEVNKDRKKKKIKGKKKRGGTREIKDDDEDNDDEEEEDDDEDDDEGEDEDDEEEEYDDDSDYDSD
ncbi:protein LURP-one-related 15-like [Bidens hawaiensis]|uniref:protein LURP-one-related 15-like n=1 Tax=Bidens hawaiensis TaxID=980011 RepID=UPI004048EE5E